ncbi:hypothetical protein [Cellulomonas aerilata]|uniref:Uncharacterized protein n=1 Tax=Cellulomonas aerilata TaxID=515326 RepID=A0A512DBB0_9CELL|nr:hypothetical protein [Cellulomonas aerilata]GEO33520.1 hypothetical protein CAE01nite_12450 [Cellulomonas aerilata]
MAALVFSRPVSANRAGVLSTATVLIAAVCAVTALVPFSNTAPRGVAGVLSVAGFAVAAVLRRQARGGWRPCLVPA